MQTNYVFVVLTPDKKGVSYTESFSERNEAIRTYQKLCEANPKSNYKVIRRDVIEKTIAESDDCRQTKFSF